MSKPDKAPTENQNMQAVELRPWDRQPIDLSGSNDWLTPMGKARAARQDKMRERRAEHRAKLQERLDESLRARKLAKSSP